MKKVLLFIFLTQGSYLFAQHVTDLSRYNKNSEAKVAVAENIISVNWPTGINEKGVMVLDLDKDNPLFKSISIQNKEIVSAVDPAFILTIGKRTLTAEKGWTIFFDKVPERPYQSYPVVFDKENATVSTEGSRTIIRIDKMTSATFSGALEITLYNGSALFNVAAVLSTQQHSAAILYDAGMVSANKIWNNVAWTNTDKQLKNTAVNMNDTAMNLAVKYRTVIGENAAGSMAVFPAPHQYFYPLDEAFNLKFTWYGNSYQNIIKGYGIGIRQQPEGDKRFVPWFNAPPGTQQRLNFFCLLSTGKANETMEQVKKFTRNDQYAPLKGYKAMVSHFHNEFIMNVVMGGKPVPEKPEFVEVLKGLGIDIVHLGEFHYTAHPKGPDEQRLAELKALFDQCKRLSDKKFLLLPGEEPNEFFGGHWMALFPKRVYWVMDRKEGMPFLSEDKKYGKVYRIADKEEMLKLLELENGLAWTAHARLKGSTGYPDKYKEENFFKSGRFLGAAWKAMPADLSYDRLGKRVLNLLDDYNNWGLQKHVIGESDIFTITHENEMYAHLNVNYLQLDKLPAFNNGWQPVLNSMQEGKFFTTTGEVLLPSFTVNGKGAGETIALDAAGNAAVDINIEWTFPLNFVEIISGDGEKVYREKINLSDTRAFGKKQYHFSINLKNRTWVRLEVWDAAVNGAFTQTVYIK